MIIFTKDNNNNEINKRSLINFNFTFFIAIMKQIQKS